MSQEEINALKRACFYSIPPNKLGYCGPVESRKLLQEFISNPAEESAEIAKEQLTHFTALFPYLELIATENNLQPFDSEVIEAYWIGNSLLENVSFREIQKTILSFQHFGLPHSIAKKKAKELPDGIIPHHSMHVLYVNFISQKVDPIVKNLSSCLVQWAKVLEETPKGIRAKGIELFSESGELKLREKEKTLQNSFGLKLAPGELVSVHWNNVVEQISEDELKRLEKYTKATLEAIRL